MGFRRDWEPVDGRPLLVERFPFWASESERLTYENAAEEHPRNPAEGPMAYAARLSAIVTERFGRAVQPMPHVRMSRRERDAALAKLRGQAAGLPSGVEDYS